MSLNFRRLAKGFILLACVGLLLFAATRSEPRVVFRSHRSMGTQLTISIFTTDEKEAVAAMLFAFAEFDRIDRTFTVWREDSVVSAINRAAGQSPVSISAEAFKLLQSAVAFSAKTDGAFDISFGALSQLWRFDHDQDNQLPDAAAIKAQLPLVNYRHLQLNAQKQTAFLSQHGARIHLGGIAKGYAVDRAVSFLRAAGFENFMVQAGGDLYVAGAHGARPWRVGVRDPRGPPSKYFAAVEVTDATFSTSGDYERYFFHQGQRYHHILDPRTGWPARACRSVTVMAQDAMTADALSTALFILGPERGMAVLAQFPGVEAVFVDPQNVVHTSKGLKNSLKLLAQPTDAP